VTWTVHKFGGTSLADAACFRRVADIVVGQPEGNLAVVVSAIGGVTDLLLGLIDKASRDQPVEASIDDLWSRYEAIVRELLSEDRANGLIEQFSQELENIGSVLKALSVVKAASHRSRDLVAGCGEPRSARLLAALLDESNRRRGAVACVDARDVLVVERGEMGPIVAWEPTREKCKQVIPDDYDGVVVVTGFIARNREGLQTTLGRNGSDYSAAIFAALSQAAELCIWTDVDGVMSADPNRVPEAQVIEQLTYNEAMELAYFGANVIHPQTLGPVVDKSIPMRIRNSYNPSHPGSRIVADAAEADNIKGITAIGEMTLVNIEGAGMIGVPGTADRMFSALRHAGVSVTLISQASSEHSICIAVPQELAERATQVIGDAFAEELESGQIQSVDRTDAQSIVAVVGDGMQGTPGIAARFLGSLGRASINVRAIAQGSSERNISVVVDSNDVTRALRAAHSGFYLSSKTISIGLIGPGTVGATLLQQIERRAEQLKSTFNVDLRVRAIARSQSMLLDERRIDLANWPEQFDAAAVAADFDAFEQCVNPDHLPHAVIIDCTASEDVASRYAGWLERGIHIITPNKRACSGPIDDYRNLQSQAERGNAHFFYETTVGAALPIISTLRDLIDTGDEIHSVQGIFSGTLAYLFNVYDGSTPFSEIVRQARDSGYTEPDPRDDLSGMDVARKLTILARELGLAVCIGDFSVQNLVPEALRNGDIDSFLDQLSDYDSDVKSMYDKAKAENKKLRYIGRLDAAGNVSVGLESVEASHPFSNINLTDNIVQFETARYSANPLYVQGPGAGPEVTAGGVFAELLRLAKFLSVAA